MEGIRGGHIEHGLLMGLASSGGGELLSSYGGSLSYAEQVVANAVLGGVVSELGGGKFANGAMTAAYTMMFNDLAHNYTNGDDDNGCTNKKVSVPIIEENEGVFYLNGHIVGEKPLECIWPEFDILTGIRGFLNTLTTLFYTNSNVIATFLYGNQFTRLKGGVRQIFVDRNDINKLFRRLASQSNAKIHYNGKEQYFNAGKYRVGLHKSTRGGGQTIHINYNNREILYKIRSK